MYQRTIEELQKDEREKVIIDIRREADFLRETYPRCPRTARFT